MFVHGIEKARLNGNNNKINHRMFTRGATSFTLPIIVAIVSTVSTSTNPPMALQPASTQEFIDRKTDLKSHLKLQWQYLRMVII